MGRLSQGWLKLYYRDENKVMRAVPGLKLLPGSTLRLAKSVYTLAYSDVLYLWYEVEE